MDIRFKTVSNAIARRQLYMAHAIGMSGDELLRSAGIQHAELQRENGRLEAQKHIRLARMFAHVPIPYEKFIYGGLDPLFSDFPLLATVCANCPTQREALRTFMQFRGIIGELDFLSFHEAQGRARFEFVSEAMPAPFDKGAFANFMNLAHIARHYRMGERLPMRCHLTGPASPDAAAVEDFLEGKVLYDQACNSLEFSAAHLDTPYPQFNPLLHRIYRRKLSDELAALPTRGSYSTQVEQTIRDIFTAQATSPTSPTSPTGDAMLKSLCAHMNTTRWTLWRKLQQEGHTYQGIVLKVRTQVARSYLENPGMPLGDISHHLGFSTPSAFSRFFKDQEGIAPKLYRQRILLSEK